MKGRHASCSLTVLTLFLHLVTLSAMHCAWYVKTAYYGYKEVNRPQSPRSPRVRVRLTEEARLKKRNLVVFPGAARDFHGTKLMCFLFIGASFLDRLPRRIGARSLFLVLRVLLDVVLDRAVLL